MKIILKYSWKVQFYLIQLLSSLSTCRFLNSRTQRGISPRWLLSNRSSLKERYVPTKETRAIPLLLKALWDRRRDCRPGRRWRNVKAGMWLTLLWSRVSLRRWRGRFIRTEVNWLWDRSKVSRDLRGNTQKIMNHEISTRWPSNDGWLVAKWMTSYQPQLFSVR